MIRNYRNGNDDAFLFSHFSMKVCKKVEQKGQTTYNEVADELVQEFQSTLSASPPPPDNKRGKGVYDEKNIRRRVYDALNVLMAMDIISKEKKEIRWKGLPTNAQHDRESINSEMRLKEAEVQKKRVTLRDLVIQGICVKNLQEKNKREEAEKEKEAKRGSGAEAPEGKADADGDGAKQSENVKVSKGRRIIIIITSSPPHPNPSLFPLQPPTTTGAPPQEKIPLPFIVVNTPSTTVIQCEMRSDRTDVFFNFSAPFEIHDDFEVMKRLGLDKCTEDDVREIVNDELFCYLKENDILKTIVKN